MTHADYIIGDVHDVTATIADDSIDLIVTSPPFLALRSYLPADHPDKGKEIGSEPTPAAFIDTMLALTAEWRRVLAPHGSICVELGDTYSGPQPPFTYTEAHSPDKPMALGDQITDKIGVDNITGRVGAGWPLAKSLALIPEAYRFALAYGRNPHTGQASPAGQWRVRNNVRWARPNPPVGSLGDKFRPATSDMVIACVSGQRYFDLDAVREPHKEHTLKYPRNAEHYANDGYAVATRVDGGRIGSNGGNPAGAPPLDYWVIPTAPYAGSHYATYPPELVRRPILAMCPLRVCRVCGEPSRRIVDTSYVDANGNPAPGGTWASGVASGRGAHSLKTETRTSVATTLGWSECGHDDWRTGIVLDPFAGSGTTLTVATGHGRDALGIDLDERNADLAVNRIGPLLCTIHNQRTTIRPPPEPPHDP